MSMVAPACHPMDGLHHNPYTQIASHAVAAVLPPPRSYYVVSWVPRALPEVVQLIKEIPSESERCLINKHFELGMLVMRRCGVQNPEEIKCLLDGFREGTTRLSSKEPPKSPIENNNSMGKLSTEGSVYSSGFCCSPTVERRKLLIFFNDHRASRPWVLCPAKHCIKSARTTGKVKGRVKIFQFDQRSATVKIPKLFLDCLSDFLTRDHYVFATFCPQQKYTDHELEWFDYPRHQRAGGNVELGGDTIFRELVEEHDTKGSRMWPFEDYIIFSNSQAKIVAVFKKKQPLLTLYRQTWPGVEDCASVTTTASSMMLGPFVSPSGIVTTTTSCSSDGCCLGMNTNTLSGPSVIEEGEPYQHPGLGSSASEITKSELIDSNETGAKEMNSTTRECLLMETRHSAMTGHNVIGSVTSMASTTTSVGDDEDDTEHDLVSACTGPPARRATRLQGNVYRQDNGKREEIQGGFCSSEEGRRSEDEDTPDDDDSDYKFSNRDIFKLEKKCTKTVKDRRVRNGGFQEVESDTFQCMGGTSRNSTMSDPYCVNANFSGMRQLQQGPHGQQPNSLLLGESPSPSMGMIPSADLVRQAEEAELVLVRIMTRVLGHLEPLDDAANLDLSAFNLERQSSSSSGTAPMSLAKPNSPPGSMVSHQYHQNEDHTLRHRITGSFNSSGDDDDEDGGASSKAPTTTMSSTTSATDTADGVSSCFGGDCLRDISGKLDTSGIQAQQRRKIDLATLGLDLENKRRKVIGYPSPTNAVLYHELVRQFLSRLAFGLDHPPLPQKRIPDTVKRVVTKIVTDSIKEINLALLTSSIRCQTDSLGILPVTNGDNGSRGPGSSTSMLGGAPGMGSIGNQQFSTFWSQGIPGSNGSPNRGHAGNNSVVMGSNSSMYGSYDSQSQQSATSNRGTGGGGLPSPGATAAAVAASRAANAAAVFMHHHYGFGDQIPSRVPVCGSPLGIGAPSIFQTTSSESNSASPFSTHYDNNAVDAATAAVLASGLNGPGGGGGPSPHELLEYIGHHQTGTSCTNLTAHGQFLANSLGIQRDSAEDYLHSLSHTLTSDGTNMVLNNIQQCLPTNQNESIHSHPSLHHTSLQDHHLTSNMGLNCHSLHLAAHHDTHERQVLSKSLSNSGNNNDAFNPSNYEDGVKNISDNEHVPSIVLSRAVSSPCHHSSVQQPLESPQQANGRRDDDEDEMDMMSNTHLTTNDSVMGSLGMASTLNIPNGIIVEDTTHNNNNNNNISHGSNDLLLTAPISRRSRSAPYHQERGDIGMVSRHSRRKRH